MIVIDGSRGEGGGQVLRSSLGMALVTGQAVRLHSIRAGRRKPGLKRQHLTCVRAAVEVGGGAVHGDVMNGMELEFRPGRVRSGDYRFAVGTAGSASLVLQTILPALMLASGPSTVVIEGGTHAKWAPPWPFLERSFLPVLRRAGVVVRARCDRPGFYPAGGGRLTVEVEPVERLVPVEIYERGAIHALTATAVVSRLPSHIGDRQIATLRRHLSLAEAIVERVDSPGPGNALFVDAAAEAVHAVFSGFGDKGVPAERVAEAVATRALRWLDVGAPVCEHLADQLLIPLVLAGGGGFRTCEPSLHTTTNIEVLARFSDVRVAVVQESERVWRISA